MGLLGLGQTDQESLLLGVAPAGLQEGGRAVLLPLALYSCLLKPHTGASEGNALQMS